MDLETRQLLVCLVAAHVLGDFLLQTQQDVKEKSRPVVLVKHTLVLAVLSYLVVGWWRVWQIPVLVLFTHAGIDLVKARLGKGAGAFLVDQAAHGLSLLIIASVLSSPTNQTLHWVQLLGAPYLKMLILLSGFVVCVYGIGYLVGLAVQPLLNEMATAAPPTSHDIPRESRGFAQGGQLIGRLERALIFLLVLSGQMAGVGFLIAAKSIFRFGELREHRNRMEAEYILIGTLMSFAGGLFVSHLTWLLMGMIWV
jgi:hypothetical protein